MKSAIVGYHTDEERHWVAELNCGHHQHVRNNPPWTCRPWLKIANPLPKLRTLVRVPL